MARLGEDRHRRLTTSSITESIIMHKLLKISAIALAAFATATAFAEDEKEKEHLHLKKEASKEEVRKFCGFWIPIVKVRKLEGAFEGEGRREAREGYERHCRKHEKEWGEKEAEGYERRDHDDKDKKDK
jgi:hypothetical protein